MIRENTLKRKKGRKRGRKRVEKIILPFLTVLIVLTVALFSSCKMDLQETLYVNPGLDISNYYAYYNGPNVNVVLDTGSGIAGPVEAGHFVYHIDFWPDRYTADGEEFSSLLTNYEEFRFWGDWLLNTDESEDYETESVFSAYNNFHVTVFWCSYGGIGRRFSERNVNIDDIALIYPYSKEYTGDDKSLSTGLLSLVKIVEEGIRAEYVKPVPYNLQQTGSDLTYDKTPSFSWAISWVSWSTTDQSDNVRYCIYETGSTERNWVTAGDLSTTYTNTVLKPENSGTGYTFEVQERSNLINIDRTQYGGWGDPGTTLAITLINAAPVVTTTPSGTVTSNYTFTANVTDGNEDDTFYYQWEDSSDNVTYNPVSGATSSSYTSVFSSGTSYLRVIVSDGTTTDISNNMATSVTSAVVTLNIP